MTGGVFLGLGRVVTVSPLTVRVNGDTESTAAEALSDFTGSTANVTEVLVWAAERRRFALRVRTA